MHTFTEKGEQAILQEDNLYMRHFRTDQADVRQEKSFTDSSDELTPTLLLELIVSICPDDDPESLVVAYREHCEQDFPTTWGFDALDPWLGTAELGFEKRERIGDVSHFDGLPTAVFRPTPRSRSAQAPTAPRLRLSPGRLSLPCSCATGRPAAA